MFSLANSPFDVVVMAIFGAAGYLFNKIELETAPMLLALILGPRMEEHLRRAMRLSRGDPSIFVTRPISLAELGLATDLGVSRGTVKKALLMLESENLVVIEESRRARVRSFSVEEMQQYLELRMLVEGFVARLSAPFLTEEDLAEMRAILAEMKICLETQELLEYSKNNWKFHEVIYRACQNKPAVEMVLSIKNQFRRYNIRTILVKGRDEKSFAEHSAILEALEARDGAKVEEVMRAHIANMSEVIRKNSAILF